jgi:hypothetical protein
MARVMWGSPQTEGGIVPALVFQGFSRTGQSKQVGLCGQAAVAGGPEVLNMLTQFASRTVFAAMFE